MSSSVMKFGGSSMGSPERIQRALSLIAAEREQGPLAVVVSAMGDTTDWLIEASEHAAKGDLDNALRLVDQIEDKAASGALMTLAKIEADSGRQVSGLVRAQLKSLRQLLHGVALLLECSEKTLDLVLSFGERLSAGVLAELLTAKGVPSLFVDARDWVVTDARFGSAVVDWKATQGKIDAQRAAWSDLVSVHTGFIGSTEDGRTTTLGRNGSDYTATLLARGLGADEVQIWTDVSGVMTADPGIVKDAYPTPELSYMEALELANFGASMFHARTMIPLIESGIPMRIRNTMRPEEPGTRISSGGAPSTERPTCVTSLESQALLDVRWKRLSHEAQVGERVLRALEAASVTVWMGSQAAHGQAIAVVVPKADVDRAVHAIHAELELELARSEVEGVGVRAPVTLLTLVAERMSDAGGVAGRFFSTLGDLGVAVRAIAQGASSRSISCVIDAADTVTAVQSVHAAFNFAHQEVSLFLLGVGVVGRELLSQIRDQRAKLRDEYGVDLRVVGAAHSAHFLFESDGIDIEDVDAAIARVKEATPWSKDARAKDLEALQKRPVPILIDCTAEEGLESLYEAAFAKGIHVVAANKKPLSQPRERYESLLSKARRQHRFYRYETTVGASLPVIETLKNLVRTGDRIELIEGSFSGSLGFITNEATGGMRLSAAVRKARELGYTEPQPREDLSGMDVARKALILARELGTPLNLADIGIEPLVPKEVLAVEDVDEFLARLEDEDARFEERLAALRSESKVLRYLASIRFLDGKAEVNVGPKAVDADHPASTLKGSEAFVAFTTARYSTYPLVVRGAGAGGAVTAAGVLADILAVTQSLKGR